MRAPRRFLVDPVVPAELAPLLRLADNLHWTWDRSLAAIFERLDPAAWDEMGRDPHRLVAAIDPERWAQLARDTDLVHAVHDADARLTEALTSPRWFQERSASPLGGVAYFSPEFGISETLPQYSGGLGVLAGDHLKAASDLGVPLVGVGLLYAEGYFRQALDADGWQQERFPRLEPSTLALTRTDVTVEVELGAETARCAIWRADVGRIPLYLLDTAVEGNTPETAAVTDRLYGGDTEHRLRQEIVLGVGGVRALRALGHAPDVFHTNEGHAGFLALERIRELVATGLTFDEALEASRAGGVFTTHTPVPAGIDRFAPELMQKYFTATAARLGITFERLMALGQRDDEPDGKFNMAVMGLRLAARSNGVAQLHGAVSRKMFAGLWPTVPVDEVPIGAITNGVHARTWVADSIDALLTEHVHPVWDGADGATWNGALGVPAKDVWAARSAGRAELVAFVRERLGDDVLQPDALTIGFARRFATYKRATLLLSQRERLIELLTDEERPLQFVFAGKAHPADHPGKEMIQAIERFARDASVRHQFVFLPDYDMAVARAMYHGCDVWLNNPRRPLEACGTSGMKAALNGSLNCSVRDGWWDEWHEGGHGWTIPSADDDPDLARRDSREATSLFGLLEREIVPLFYRRDPDGIPHGWIERVRNGWAVLGPKVTASRMVRDYVTELYEPAAAASRHLLSSGARPARELAAWKRRVIAAWPGVKLVEMVVDANPGRLGEQRTVRVVADLAGLSPSDVRVEAIHGVVTSAGDLTPGAIHTPLSPAEPGSFTGSITINRAGAYGVNARIVPTHPDLASVIELGRVVWAG